MEAQIKLTIMVMRQCKTPSTSDLISCTARVSVLTGELEELLFLTMSEKFSFNLPLTHLKFRPIKKEEYSMEESALSSSCPTDLLNRYIKDQFFLEEHFFPFTFLGCQFRVN